MVAPVARGGMAEVWEGHDETLSRPVAVKVLQAHLAGDGVFLERFRREAVTAARLAHPCVVSMYDTGIDDGTAYIVMELVRGDTLRRFLSDHGPLDPPLALNIGRQIADALAGAHQAGLVHRDIKPANILLVDDGWGGLRVKVTDFGIAKASQGLGADLTRTGTVLGTPKYLSPEQIRGEEPDARADLYSLGVVVFEMLAGEPPYSGGTDMATALAHLNDRVPKLSAHVPGAPRALEQLVNDLLAKDPDQRVPSAAALRERIDSLGSIPATAGAAPATSSGRTSARTSPSSRDRLDEVSSRARGGTRTLATSTEQTSVLGGLTSPATANGPAREAERGPVSASGTSVASGGDGTHSLRGHGPATDEFGPGNLPRANGRPAVTRRRVAIVVATLVAVGGITAAGVLSGSARRTHSSTSGPAQGGSGVGKIADVVVYMSNAARPPDNPSMARFAIDGDPSTYWPTDLYSSPTFGNLYPGIGLEVQLNGPQRVGQLAVTSPTSGWSAQTYLSDSQLASGSPLGAWGAPTDTKSNIAPGTVTFNFAARRGQWILLWITNLGPSDEARIAELSVR